MFLDSERMQEYIDFEQKIGITEEKFHKTYVFETNPLSVQDIIDKGVFLTKEKAYIKGETPSPSQLQGLPLKEEKRIRKMACEMIFQGAILIRLQVNVAVMAQQLFHRFYFRRSMMEFDVREVVMGCVFLACKMEDIARKSRDIVMVFNYIFKQYCLANSNINSNNHPNSLFRHIELTSNKYLLIRENVIEVEKIILHEIGYETFRVVDTAHKYLMSFLKVLQLEKAQAQTALGYLNDAYKTVLCVQYPPQMLIAGCIYLALRVNKTPMIHRNWWNLMETGVVQIQNIAKELVYMYSLKTTTIPEYKAIISLSNIYKIQKVLPLDLEQIELKAQQEQLKLQEQQQLNLQNQKNNSTLNANNSNQDNKAKETKTIANEKKKSKYNRDEDRSRNREDNHKRKNSRSRSRSHQKKSSSKSKKYKDHERNGSRHHKTEDRHKEKRIKSNKSESRERRYKREKEKERDREERNKHQQKHQTNKEEKLKNELNMDKVLNRIKEKEQELLNEQINIQQQQQQQPKEKKEIAQIQPVQEDSEAQMMKTLHELKKKMLDRRLFQKKKEEEETKQLEEEFF